MAGKRKGLSFNRKRRKQINYDIVLDVIGWIVPIMIVILIAGVLVNLFAVRSNMIGSAMESTIGSNEQVFINKFHYILEDPKMDDVIVFLPNGNERSHYYIRRIAAVPGDEVVIRDGSLYVNGTNSSGYFANTYLADPGICEEPIILGEDEYFVLGDNPSSSEDSRFANIGNIKKSYIIGKVWYRYAAFSDMGLIN